MSYKNTKSIVGNDLEQVKRVSWKAPAHNMIDDNVENLICSMDSRSVALDKSSILFNNKTSKKRTAT